MLSQKKNCEVEKYLIIKTNNIYYFCSSFNKIRILIFDEKRFAFTNFINDFDIFKLNFKSFRSNPFNITCQLINRGITGYEYGFPDIDVEIQFIETSNITNTLFIISNFISTKCFPKRLFYKYSDLTPCVIFSDEYNQEVFVIIMDYMSFESFGYESLLTDFYEDTKKSISLFDKFSYRESFCLFEFDKPPYNLTRCNNSSFEYKILVMYHETKSYLYFTSFISLNTTSINIDLVKDLFFYLWESSEYPKKNETLSSFLNVVPNSNYQREK